MSGHTPTSRVEQLLIPSWESRIIVLRSFFCLCRLQTKLKRIMFACFCPVPYAPMHTQTQTVSCSPDNKSWQQAGLLAGIQLYPIPVCNLSSSYRVARFHPWSNHCLLVVPRGCHSMSEISLPHDAIKHHKTAGAVSGIRGRWKQTAPWAEELQDPSQ